MMKYFNVISFAFLIIIIGCNKNWDDYYSVKNNNLKYNILETIKENPELSKFYDFLTKTGYDQILQSSKNYYVWAPKNDAFNNFDTSGLKSVIGFYISFSPTIETGKKCRIKMINGKYTEIDTNSIESSKILSVTVCKNGILHIIDKAYTPKPNIWEYFQTKTDNFLQKKFIDKLFTEIFDKENSKPIGIDQNTGLTIYDTIRLWKNIYLTNVANLENESELFTYIILSDNAFQTGVDTFKRYFKPLNDSLNIIKDSLAAYNVCNELAIIGKYKPSELPSYFSTTNGNIIRFNASDIDSFVETSNGIIYFLNSLPIKENDKFKSIIIEGENLEKASSKEWIIRKVNEASGSFDILFDNTSAAKWIQYSVYIPYPAKYQFYCTSVFKSDSTTSQNIGLFTFNPSETTSAFYKFPSFKSTKDYSSEIYLGEYTFTSEMNISLRISNVSATKQPPVTLDYIRIIPVK